MSKFAKLKGYKPIKSNNVIPEEISGIKPSIKLQPQNAILKSIILKASVNGG